MAFWQWSSAGLSTELPLGDAAWDVTWDFRERALTAADGKSSMAAHAIQAEDKHFVFFGWLGAIRAAKNFGSPLVGFAIVSKELSKTNHPGRPTALEMEVRSDSPEIQFDVLVEDSALQKANRTRGQNASHLAPLTVSDGWKTCRFTPADFSVVSRGVELQGENSVDLTQIRRFGFQVRKSAQRNSLKTSTERTPFHLEVRSVRWAP